MNIEKRYKLQCDCHAIQLEITGKPIVHAYCHCQDCRDLHGIPVYAVAAWNKERVKVLQGNEDLGQYKYPGKEMVRFFCEKCGSTLYNSNMYDWRAVPQSLIRKCYAGELPAELASNKHFFYGERVVDIKDELPKYVKGSDGPLFKE